MGKDDGVYREDQEARTLGGTRGGTLDKGGNM